MQARLWIRLLCGTALLASSALAGVAPPAAQARAASAPSCPVAHFRQVQSANATLPAPALAVSCDGANLYVKTNAIPDFPYVATSPGVPTALDLNFTIPLQPTYDATPAETPRLGSLGVAVDGVPLFGPTDAGGGDAILLGLLSVCGGHNGPPGYHLHTFGFDPQTQCLFDYDTVSGNPALVIGYAFDGYPIMAPFVCADAACRSVREVRSSWVLRDAELARSDTWSAHQYQAGAGDLDACNGMLGADGQYRYYATRTFPYLIGCFRGEVDLAVARGDNAGGAPAPAGPPSGAGGPPPNRPPPPGRPPRPFAANAQVGLSLFLCHW